MSRPFLVGESNPYGADPEFALYPAPKFCSGWRLCVQIMGLEPDDYLSRFERRNLLAGPGWSVPRAREAADALRPEIGGATVVLLGRKVTAAFGQEFVPFSRVAYGKKTAYVVLPHPSGLCRVWNMHGSYERARRALREAGAL